MDARAAAQSYSVLMSDNDNAAFQPFKSFEHRGWREVAERYDTAFVSATGQSIVPMLDAVNVGSGMRLLDVACGPGYATAAAAARGGTVLGIDFAAEMVALAQRKWPGGGNNEDGAAGVRVPRPPTTRPPSLAACAELPKI